MENVQIFQERDRYAGCMVNKTLTLFERTRSLIKTIIRYIGLVRAGT